MIITLILINLYLLGAIPATGYMFNDLDGKQSITYREAFLRGLIIHFIMVITMVGTLCAFMMLTILARMVGVTL